MDQNAKARVPISKFTHKLTNKPPVVVAATRYKKRYDSELPYQRPDLIEVMEIEIDLTTSTNVHTGYYISVRECLD